MIFLCVLLALLVGTGVVVWAWMLPSGILTRGGSGGDAAIYDGEECLVSFTFEYHLHPIGAINRLKFTVAVPRSLDRRQEVLELSYSCQPEEIFEQGQNRYAVFLFTDLEDDLVLHITGKARLLAYDLASAMEGSEPGRVPELDAYLEAERYLEKEDSEIQDAARGITGKDETETVEMIFDYVLANMEYGGYESEEVGAAEALRRKYGDCSEFSDLFVTLCRAKGIAAKCVDGFIVDDADSLYVHSWVEVYLEDYGWVPFDPTFADGGYATFEEVEPRLLRVCDVRNNETLDNYHFWSYYFEGDDVEITDSYVFTRCEE